MEQRAPCGVVGMSREGRPITCRSGGDPGVPCLLVLGGIHGDEPKGVTVARRLIDELDAKRRDCRWAVVPVVNPDGYDRRRRRNANRVDINRNFPTDNWTLQPAHSRMYGGDAPASEPETQAVIDVVEAMSPTCIIALHSIDNMRFCNNYDGPAEALAGCLSQHNHYPVSASIGYPTPGSLGNWAGVERGLPMITLELPSHHSPKRCWDDNRPALLAALNMVASS